MKFSITDFFSKRYQIHRKLCIWSHLLKKSVMENFIFCVVYLTTSWFKEDGLTCSVVASHTIRQLFWKLLKLRLRYKISSSKVTVQQQLNLQFQFILLLSFRDSFKGTQFYGNSILPMFLLNYKFSGNYMFFLAGSSYLKYSRHLLS